MTPIQIITINGTQRSCKFMIEKVSSEKFRAYKSFKIDSIYEPFNFYIEDKNELNLLDKCYENFLSRSGEIKNVDNQNSDIYKTNQIKKIFDCEVTES